MKKNFVIAVVMTFVLLFSPTTAYASESSNVGTDVAVRESETLYTHIYKYGARIRIKEPYTSDTFRAITDRVEILFGGVGSTGTYTYYLEEQNPNGSWTVINSHTVRYMGTISTSVYVTPNNTYRVRAITTDKYADAINLEVFEYIFD